VTAILGVNDVRGNINAHVDGAVAFLKQQQVSKLFLTLNGFEVSLKGVTGVLRVAKAIIGLIAEEVEGSGDAILTGLAGRVRIGVQVQARHRRHEVGDIKIRPARQPANRFEQQFDSLGVAGSAPISEKGLEVRFGRDLQFHEQGRDAAKGFSQAAGFIG